jgi:hypothetical protein
MKKTFPLGRMSVQEMDALDANKDLYKKVFELHKKHKKSFVSLEIREYGGEYFYGLHCCFKAANLYYERGFAALRKWGTYTSLRECKEAAIRQLLKTGSGKKEKIILDKLDLWSYRQTEFDFEMAGKKTE